MGVFVGYRIASCGFYMEGCHMLALIGYVYQTRLDLEALQLDCICRLGSSALIGKFRFIYATITEQNHPARDPTQHPRSSHQYSHDAFNTEPTHENANKTQHHALPPSITDPATSSSSSQPTPSAPPPQSAPPTPSHPPHPPATAPTRPAPPQAQP